MRRSVVACGIALLHTAAALSATPNVLFIAVDDLRTEHGVYGGSAITPNIGVWPGPERVQHGCWPHGPPPPPSNHGLLRPPPPTPPRADAFAKTATLFTRNYVQQVRFASVAVSLRPRPVVALIFFVHSLHPLLHGAKVQWPLAVSCGPTGLGHVLFDACLYACAAAPALSACGLASHPCRECARRPGHLC
jgi:hypothetical protein